MQFLINFAVGVATGIITGFGIGGGTLLVLCLTLFWGFGQVEAQGVNLVYFLPSASLALISHIRNGRVEKKTAISAGISGTVTALFAAFIATKMNTESLSRYFGIFLLMIACREIVSIFREKRKK